MTKTKQQYVDELCKAVKDNDQYTLKTLLTESITLTIINEADHNGYTPLYLACARANEKVALHLVKQLMVVKPKVDQKGEDRETPLYIAVHNQLGEVAKFLLSLGAKINEINGATADTALHCASKFGYDSVAQILIEGGANINVRNSRMETPLFQAARAGRISTVYLLLTRDANKALPNDEGKGPLYIASENGHKGIVHMLKTEKQFLKQAKADADYEERNKEPSIADPQQLELRAEKLKKVDEEEKKKEALQPKPEMIKIDTPEKVERTHDPFTGKELPPEFKTVVGATPAPVIPKGVVKPLKDERYGGTQRVVGTGTGARVKQREALLDDVIPDSNVVFGAYDIAPMPTYKSSHKKHS